MTRQLRNICMLMIRLRIGRAFPGVAPPPGSLLLYVLSQLVTCLGKNKEAEAPILQHGTGLSKATRDALTRLLRVLIVIRASRVSLPVTGEELGLAEVWSTGRGRPCERCAGLARLCKRFDASEPGWI